MLFTTQKCPCGSGIVYENCCAPLHTGKLVAETAEQLMRSRYAAYALKQVDYLYATTHPDKRAPDLKQQTEAWIQRAEFVKLELLSTRQGRVDDKLGKVEFIAHYRQYGELRQMRETSRFRRFKGRWHYFDGEIECS